MVVQAVVVLGLRSHGPAGRAAELRGKGRMAGSFTTSPVKKAGTDLNWDLATVVWMQNLFGPESAKLWSIVTQFGSAPALMLATGLALWTHSTKLGMRLLVGLLLVNLVVDALKVLIQHPRPYYAYEAVQPWWGSDGFGMPSGHASAVLVATGVLAVSLNRRWMWGVAVLATLLVSASRIYLGVHSALQVVGGWAIAALVIFAVFRLEKPAISLCQTLRWWSLSALAATCVIALVLFKALVVANLAAKFDTPESWSYRYVQGQSFEAKIRDKEPSKFKSPRLFHKPEVANFGPVVGVWILAIYLSGREGSLAPSSRREQVANVVVGLLFFGFILAPLMGMAKDVQFAAAAILAAMPLAMAVGVPSSANFLADSVRAKPK